MVSRIRSIRVVIIVCFAVLLVGSTFYVESGSTNTTWQDNFEDHNLEDWIITRGVFSAEQKTLWAFGTASATSNRAYHESNMTVGSWSFDILLKQNWMWRYHPPAIRFMVDSLDDITWQGYVLDFYTLTRPIGPILAVYLRVRAETWDYLSHFEFDKPAHGWQSINIVRTQNGRITVNLNGSMIIDITDNSIITSNYFVFDSEDCVKTVFDPDTHIDLFVEARESPMLDNIVVAEFREPIGSEYTVIMSVISTVFAGSFLLIIGFEGINKRKKLSIPE